MNNSSIRLILRKASLKSSSVESERSDCRIIAEIGINHNGSIELCKKLIMAAKVAGVFDQYFNILSFFS